jgi:CheY-like chemotaxis protein
MTKKILVVEDYEDARVLMRAMIEQQGHQVIEASGAYEAIAKAEEYHPDLIFMDIGLPLMDGLSTAGLIRQLEDLDRTPIIAVTGFHDIQEEADKAGLTGVLYKPVDLLELEAILEKHLSGH